MSSKKSVYISTRSENVLGPLSESDTLSGRINRCLDRYGELMSRERRTLRRLLSSDDIQVLQSLRRDWPTRTQPAGLLIGGMIAEVEDATGVSITQEVGSRLEEKLEGLTDCQQIALFEMLEAPA